MYTAIEATTEDLRLKALQLRYEVFFREEGDARYADHDKQIWADEDDGPQSRLIVGLNSEGEVVGTMRLTRLSDWPFIANEAYDFAQVASLVGMPESQLLQTVARADRGVVSSSCRRSGILSLMQQKLEQLATASGCSVIVGVHALTNTPARNALHRLGWVVCPHVSTYKGFTAQHIYKDLRTQTAEKGSI